MTKKRKRRISDYPAELRGLATNRYGGNQLQRERGLKGAKLGPASVVRVFTEEERRRFEQERGYDQASAPPSLLGFPATMRELQKKAYELQKILNWVETNGPTDKCDLANVRKAIETQVRTGTYSSGTFYISKLRYPEHHRTRVSGPYDDLVIGKEGLKCLNEVLVLIERRNEYRLADHERPMRPMFR